MKVNKMFNPEKYGFKKRLKTKEVWYLDCGNPTEKDTGELVIELSFVYENGEVSLYNVVENIDEEIHWLSAIFDIPKGIIDMIKDGVIR
jgi:Mg2+ and Co2+ transporter CorA